MATKNLPAVQQPSEPGLSLDEIMKVGDLMAQSHLFDSAKTQAQAVVKILAGRELGFGPFASMTNVHVIDGKPSIGAHLLASLIKRSGRYDFTVVKCTREECELEFRRKEEKGWQPCGPNVHVTLQEFVETGTAVSKDGKLKTNWARSADDMLFARAVSKGYRRYTPDLSGGLLVYATEEMENDEPLPVKDVTSRTTVGNTPSAPPVAPPPATEDRISEEQNAELSKLLRETGTDVAKFLAAFGIKAVAQLPAKHFGEVLTKLTNRKPAAAADNADAAKAEQLRRRELQQLIDELATAMCVPEDELNSKAKQLFGKDDLAGLESQQLQQIHDRLADRWKKVQSGEIPF